MFEHHLPLIAQAAVESHERSLEETVDEPATLAAAEVAL